MKCKMIFEVYILIVARKLCVTVLKIVNFWLCKFILRLFITATIVYMLFTNVNMKYKRFHSITLKSIYQTFWKIMFLSYLFKNQVFIEDQNHKILFSSQHSAFLSCLTLLLSSFPLQLSRLKHRTWEQRENEGTL